MDWDDYHLFLNVASAGSIREAGRMIGVDHATISRRLTRLEREFGTKLLVRLPSGLRLTSAGEDLRASAERMQIEAHRVQRRLTQRDAGLEGWVRLSVNTVLGLSPVARAFLAFGHAYPDIELDITLSNDLADLTSNEADVAIRVGSSDSSWVIKTRIAGFAMAAYASEGYLERIDPRRDPAEASWLGWDTSIPFPTELKDSEFADVRVRGRFPDLRLQCEAVKEGYGIAALPCVLGDSEPSLSRLTEAIEVTSVFVLRHVDHRSTPRIRAFVEYIAEAVADHADLLEGKLAAKM